MYFKSTKILKNGNEVFEWTWAWTQDMEVAGSTPNVVKVYHFSKINLLLLISDHSWHAVEVLKLDCDHEDACQMCQFLNIKLQYFLLYLSSNIC